MALDPLDPADVAKIHAYRAMNYSHSEIALETGVSKSSVQKYLHKTEHRAKRDDVDPLAVFGDVVEDLLTVYVEVDDAE